MQIKEYTTRQKIFTILPRPEWWRFNSMFTILKHIKEGQTLENYAPPSPLPPLKSDTCYTMYHVLKRMKEINTFNKTIFQPGQEPETEEYRLNPITKKMMKKGEEKNTIILPSGYVR